MSYIVTARKWRPKVFSEVVGQQHITQTLKNAILNNRIAHAYIFTGPRGVGKTTTARILAKSLNCLSPVDAEPCNACDMCNNFNSSQSLDVIEIDGASNRRIEDIRTLRESVKYAPSSGSYKIYIIDEVHMLTTESFNALLKTLEEPPSHTIFIFATTDIHKVPLTIISRCQRFDFRRIELDTIKDLLRKISDSEKITIDDPSLTVIAKKADGALRDAQSLFDQVIAFCGTSVNYSELRVMLNLINEDLYFEISDAILEKNYYKAFEIPLQIYQNGWSFPDFITGLNEHFRNILSLIVTKKVDLIESSEIIKNQYVKYTDKFSEIDLIRILGLITKLQNEIKVSTTPRLKVEITLSQIISFERSSTITELIDRINNASSFQDLNPSEEQNINSEKKKIDPVVLSSEIIETKVSELTIDKIESQWEEFSASVTKEKLDLGILFECKIISFEKNVLSVNCKSHEHLLKLTEQQNFLSQKINHFFKNEIQLYFNLTDSEYSLSNTSENNLKGTEENSVIVKSVINDLAGKRI